MTRPLLVLLLVLAPAAARAQAARTANNDARAEALIARWIDAAGGPRVWDAVKDLRYTVTTVWYDTTGVERRRRPRYAWVKKIPGGFQVRVERTEPEGHYVQVWDGKRAWGTLNGALLPDTARALTEIPYVAGDLSYWIGLPWKLRDPGVNLRYLARDPNAPGEVVHVTFGSDVGLHPEDQYWYYFADARSAFPTQVHYLEAWKPAAARDRAIWSEWRSLGPGRYVGHRLFYDAKNRPTKTLIISDVVVNEGVAESAFRRP